MSKARVFREIDQPGSDAAQLGREIPLDEASANNLVDYQNRRGVYLWEEIKPGVDSPVAKPVAKPAAEPAPTKPVSE